MHLFATIIVIYVLIHVLCGTHHYRRNAHRPWHQRAYISLAGPWGWHLGHRL